MEGPGTEADTGFGVPWQTPLPVPHTCFSPLLPLQEFVQLAKRLIRDPALGAELVANGRKYVSTYHSWQAERDTYQRLVRMLQGDLDWQAC